MFISTASYLKGVAAFSRCYRNRVVLVVVAVGGGAFKAVEVLPNVSQLDASQQTLAPARRSKRPCRHHFFCATSNFITAP